MEERRIRLGAEDRPSSDILNKDLRIEHDRRDRTIWANAAHGLVMVLATRAQKGLVMTIVAALPLFGIAGVAWWLRPMGSVAAEVSSPRGP